MVGKAAEELAVDSVETAVGEHAHDIAPSGILGDVLDDLSIVRPPHAPSPLQVRGQLDPAPSKAIS